MKFLKNKTKNPPNARFKPGAFGSGVGALPIELLGNISNFGYFININKENMLFELWENFNIEFHRNSQQAFAYIHVISFILSGDSVIEYPTLLFPRY